MITTTTTTATITAAIRFIRKHSLHSSMADVEILSWHLTLKINYIIIMIVDRNLHVCVYCIYTIFVQIASFGKNFDVDNPHCYIDGIKEIASGIRMNWPKWMVKEKKKKLTACIQLFNTFQSLTLRLITIKLDTSWFWTAKFGSTFFLSPLHLLRCGSRRRRRRRLCFRLCSFVIRKGATHRTSKWNTHKY